MAKLVFYDKSHTYMLDGEEIPSVSELTRFIFREVYDDVNQYKLDKKAEVGRKVHKALEVLDKFGGVELEDSILPYVQAYILFCKEHEVNWEKIEWAVVSPDKDYAGTLDRYGTVDGKKTILDYKTTSVISPGHRRLYEAGQNLYRMAIQAEYPVEQIIILQLKKDGTYKIYELPISDALATACITLHSATKKRKRKRKDPANG